MRALENIHRLTAAALALGFVVTRHEGDEAQLHRQTVKGIISLHLDTAEHAPATGWQRPFACLNWDPDLDTCTDFSAIPFDINEDNEDLVRVEHFEDMVAKTLEFHEDRFVGPVGSFVVDNDDELPF